MTIRRRVPLIAATVPVLLLGACSGDEESPVTDAAPDADTGTGFPMTVENCGRELTIEDPPQEVLTIGTSAVALLHAAGASEYIAARTAEFGTAILGEAGAAVEDVPILTPDDPTAEVIMGASPDLAIGYGLYSTTAEDLEAAGIPTIFSAAVCGQSGVPFGELDGVTFDDILTDIELFGDLFGSREQAGAAVAELRERVEAVESAPDPTGLETAAGLWFADTTPYAIGKQHLLTSTMDAVGLTNVFDDLNEMTAEASAEELIGRDPDVLILVHGYADPEETFEDTKAKLLADPSLADLTAVRNDRIIGLYYGDAEPQPAAVDGLETIAADLAALAP